MKYLFFYFLFFTTTAYSQQGNTFSFSQMFQPVYLGIDKPFFKEDAYGLGYKTPGIVNQGNHYFYLSPNANLIISDGSETGTMNINVGGPNPQVAYLFATNKYVYYGKNPFKKSTENIERFNPVTNDRSSVYSSNMGVLSLDDKQVPGNTYPVSEFFVGSKKDKIFIRTSETSEGDYKLVSHVYCINDNDPDKIYTVYEDYTMTPDGDVIIATDTKIADNKNDVFFNGRAKPTGVYETSVLVCNGPQPITDSFKVISFYILKKKGLFIFDGFLRTDAAIYSLVSSVENGINKYSLWQYQGTNITEASGKLIVQADDYAAEVHDGIIYVSCQGHIFQLNEATHNFTELATPGKANAFQNISDKNRILKSGNYLMCNINGVYKIYNLLTGTWRDAETPVLPTELNRYRLTPTYAYATSKNFVYFKIVDSKEQLISYCPADNTTKTMLMPDFGRESFDHICSFSQAGDTFFFVAAYSGKKNTKTYRMFMLKD